LIFLKVWSSPAAYAPCITRNPDTGAVLTSIRLLMESQIDYEFRTTCVRPLVNAGVIDKISTLIQGSRCYALQQFHDADMLDPGFFGAGTPAYSNEELLGLKSIAESRVDTCIIRGADS